VPDELCIQRVLLVLEDFRVFLSLLVLMYSNASSEFETTSTLGLSSVRR